VISSDWRDPLALPEAESHGGLPRTQRTGGYRRRADTGSQAAIVLAAIAVTVVVLAFFAVDTLRNAPETFIAIVGITLLSVVLDLVWKRVRGDLPTPDSPSAPA